MVTCLLPHEKCCRMSKEKIVYYRMLLCVGDPRYKDGHNHCHKMAITHTTLYMHYYVQTWDLLFAFHLFHECSFCFRVLWSNRLFLQWSKRGHDEGTSRTTKIILKIIKNRGLEFIIFTLHSRLHFFYLFIPHSWRLVYAIERLLKNKSIWIYYTSGFIIKKNVHPNNYLRKLLTRHDQFLNLNCYYFHHFSLETPTCILSCFITLNALLFSTLCF